MQMTILIPAIIGMFVGSLMGLTGAGGGIISVPLLIFGLGLPLNQAAPIALASVAISAGMGAYLGYRSKILRYKAAALMSVTGLILSPLGLWLASLTPEQPLVIGFGCLLIWISLRMLFEAHKATKVGIPEITSPPFCEINPTTGKFIWSSKCRSALLFTGAATGFLSGLLGVGGGFILVPSLRKFTDLPMQSIVATTLGVISIVSSGNAILASATGNMNWTIALPFILGSIMGLGIGRKLIEKIHSNHVQQIFAILTLIIAINLIYKTVL